MDTLTVDTVVLYHAGCNDGIVAGWYAHKHLGNQATYLPYQYGGKMPEECVGKHVLMLDLSIGEELIPEWIAKVKSLCIVDHHKTAEHLRMSFDDVDTYSEYVELRDSGVRGMVLFDMGWCGAVLAWKFFNDIPEIYKQDISETLQYILDYDLWTHELVFTKAVNTWLSHGGRTFERVSHLMSGKDGSVPLDIIEAGIEFLNYDKFIIDSVVRNYVVTLDVGNGMTVALVNGPHHLRNEISDLLKDDYTYVVTYTQRADKVIYSLRSKKGGYDVSEVAAKYGGGGHVNAAAFSRPAHALDLAATVEPELFYI